MLLDKCVPIKISPGKVEYVVTIQQAGHTLMTWPKTMDTAKHRAARKAVLGALQSMHNHHENRKARQALETAAKEAGILRYGPSKSQ